MIHYMLQTKKPLHGKFLVIDFILKIFHSYLIRFFTITFLKFKESFFKNFLNKKASRIALLCSSLNTTFQQSSSSLCFFFTQKGLHSRILWMVSRSRERLQDFRDQKNRQNLMDKVKTSLNKFLPKLTIILPSFLRRRTQTLLPHKKCFILLFLETAGWLQAYEPFSLAGKYQTGIIDTGFYYKSNSGGGGWMPKMADYYGGRNNPTAILGIRRSIVPSAMVDWQGNLYTITLHNFASSGPCFRWSKMTYSNGAVSCTYIERWPWVWAYGKDPALANEPYFGGSGGDEEWFKRGFHNALSPCIVQELNDSYGTYLRMFYYIPNRRLTNSNYSNLSDFEGGYWVKPKKNNFNSIARKVGDNRDDVNRLGWNHVLPNWSVSRGKAFAHCPGNFQGFHYEKSPFYSWIFHPFVYDSDEDENAGLHCIRYNSSTQQRKGASDIEADGKVGLNSAVTILPRFFKIGSYAYYATVYNGYWVYLRRISLNQSNNDSVGTLETVGGTLLDCYIETHTRGHSHSPYSFDFFLLEGDGTPCTSSSSSSTDKILCIFGLGGGGNYCLLQPNSYWSSTYVNWSYDYAVGVIGSRYFTPNSNGNSYDYSYAYPQNTIYTTGYRRAYKNFVDIEDTSKSDEYRLYLNSHKMVLYTSPSGKHYIIYAYCYPGKKNHLYLGYAQYFIDSNHALRLTTKTEFKGISTDGWGDSFGNLTDCTRIISMDLKNGHLWITFTKETGKDATDASAAHYSYFHMLVSDLIQD